MTNEKYSRNYQNLNAAELRLMLKIYDSANFNKYTTKETVIEALTKFIPDFDTSKNKSIYYFKLDGSILHWYKDTDQIECS